MTRKSDSIDFATYPLPCILLPVSSEARPILLHPLISSTQISIKTSTDYGSLSIYNAVLDTYITHAFSGQGDSSQIEKGLLHTTDTRRRYRFWTHARYTPSRI